MSLLLIDNYDSFTYNIVELLRKLNVNDFTIAKNDGIEIHEIEKFDSIIISPGPSIPSQSGIILEAIKQFTSTKKILGICLGHQAIAEAFGAELKNYNHPQHGSKKKIKNLTKHKIFENIPTEHEIGLYHSWYVDSASLPNEFEILSLDEENTIMAIAHQNYNLIGLQFHPESYMTQYGEQIIKNWFYNI